MEGKTKARSLGRNAKDEAIDKQGNAQERVREADAVATACRSDKVVSYESNGTQGHGITADD